MATATASTSNLVRLINVAKTFPNGTRALDGLDLSVFQNDFLCILGASGCGKSTILRLLAGLEQPSNGSIEWHEENGSGSLSMVLQEATLLPWASVFDNVWMPLRMRGHSKTQARNKVEAVLELVKLPDSAALYPRELSGGMKMRVSLARALVTEPSVLLLDEPFAALDEITRFQLNDELLSLRDTLGCTVIFVTHSVFESAYLANRVAIMGHKTGRIEKEVTLTAPYPRAPNYRATKEYSASCAEISTALSTVG